jgi:hypothetical protein
LVVVVVVIWIDVFEAAKHNKPPKRRNSALGRFLPLLTLPLPPPIVRVGLQELEGSLDGI